MIEKLKSRAPLDVQGAPKRGVGIISGIFVLFGLLVLGLLGLAALDALGLSAGALSVKNFILLGLGVGSFVAVWIVLSALATRAAP